MTANYPDHAANTCRLYMESAERRIAKAKQLLQAGASAETVALVLQSVASEINWARDELLTWAESPDPPEATERAMKGRDVQQMIGGAKR